MEDKEHYATDPEKSSSPEHSPPDYDRYSEPQGSVWERFRDSFKRDPNQSTTLPAQQGSGGRKYDVDQAASNTASSPLQRKLKGRHIQMIAIGGSIGTGLFVSSGVALSTGGPASLLIGFAIIGVMLYCTVHALGEMAVAFPVAGSFSAYSTRFIDPAWGFAMGWNYALQWIVTLPLEIIAASITINYWTDGTINNSAWVAIFLVFIVAINFFGVRGYGEAEFVFSIIKVIAVIGFIILGIILNVGGGPRGGYIGGRYWSNPGAFASGFKGLCSVFVTAAFAFAGTELVGLAAAETHNPRKTLPTAVKQVFWRITLFYIVSLTLVGLLVPYDDPRLLTGGDASANAKASPFVVAINNAGIEVLPSVFNVVILIAVLSVGNSAVYGSSRTLAAMAEQRQAPKFLAYIDRQGRPLVGICVTSMVGFLAFFAGTKYEGDAFTWMITLSGLSSIITWGSICLAHIRYRAGMKAQGRSLDEVAFRAQGGVIGSYIGFTLNVLVVIANFWTGFAPIGYASETTAELVEGWWQYNISIPIVILLYVPYKLYYRTPFMTASKMDLHSGMRDLDVAGLIAEERAEKAQWPRWKRVYKFFC